LIRKSGSATFKLINKNKRLKVSIYDFTTDITTTYDSINEASKAIKINSKIFWTKERSEQKIDSVIPYHGRYVITIFRKGITNEDHLKRVELARNNVSIGLVNWKKAKGNVVVVTNINTKHTVTYNSVSETARVLNVNRITIRRRIKDKKSINGLYTFSYLECF